MKYIFAVLIVFTIFYLASSFINLSFDFNKWDSGARSGVAIFGIIFAFFSCMFLKFKDDK